MKNLILVSWLFLTSAAALAAEVPVAIIGALSEEIQSLDSRLDEKQVF